MQIQIHTYQQVTFATCVSMTSLQHSWLYRDHETPHASGACHPTKSVAPGAYWFTTRPHACTAVWSATPAQTVTKRPPMPLEHASPLNPSHRIRTGCTTRVVPYGAPLQHSWLWRDHKTPLPLEHGTQLNPLHPIRTGCTTRVEPYGAPLRCLVGKYDAPLDISQCLQIRAQRSSYMVWERRGEGGFTPGE